MKKNISETLEELFLFAEEYNLRVLLDKPFKQMPQFVLVVNDKEGVTIGQIILEDIYDLNEKAATLLNELSKNAS